jgi:sugar phosphate permease
VISNWIPEYRRGLALGVMHGCGRLANALAPLIVTGLIVSLTWRASFVVLGVITILFFGFLYAWFRDEPRAHPAISESELAVLGRSSGKITTGRTLEPIVWPDLLWRVWPASAACFAHGWMLWFFLNWVPSYFSTRYGMKIEASAVFSTLVLLGGGRWARWQGACCPTGISGRPEIGCGRGATSSFSAFSARSWASCRCF